MPEVTADRLKKYSLSKRWQKRAHELIPGGSHTYSKGDDQFPELAPGFMVRGKGCHAWDPDGNEYIEYGMGLRSVTLGHAFDPVVKAVADQIRLGSNFTRPSTIEVECAEMVVGMIESAEQVKFAKDGSTVITAATRLARAYTGRKLIAFCEDHPFFSYNDWFIGCGEMAGGIPEEETALSIRFRYNDIESLRVLFDKYPNQISCVVMEAERTDRPADGYLLAVQNLCRKQGAVFILDEMITGFRWHNQGAQHVYGLDPDLCGFGKALANGFSLSALTGKREIMELGGLRTDKERVFLLSTTHGAETHVLAAGIATMKYYQEHDVIGTLHRRGERLTAGINTLVAESGLEGYFGVAGRPCNLVYFTCDAEKKPSQPYRTLFMQEIIKRGVIGPSFVVSYSHTDADIDRTVEVVAEALEVYKKALDEGVEKYLIGRSVKPVDRKYV